jgi:hypothetical protein
MKADFKLLCEHLLMFFCVLLKIVTKPVVMLSQFVDQRKNPEVK